MVAGQLQTSDQVESCSLNIVEHTFSSSCVAMYLRVCKVVERRREARALLASRGTRWKGVSVEELALSVLLGHGYKWVAAASGVI